MSLRNYAGDVTVQQAWAALQQDKAAVLIDVRTQPEWQFVGVPDLAQLAKEPLLVSWQFYPAMAVNDNFVAQLCTEGIEKEQTLYLLCRSGVRSVAASVALCAEGFQAFNVRDGFEGGLDAQGRRGQSAGWKAAGLPWRQG